VCVCEIEREREIQRVCVRERVGPAAAQVLDGLGAHPGRHDARVAQRLQQLPLQLCDLISGTSLSDSLSLTHTHSLSLCLCLCPSVCLSVCLSLCLSPSLSLSLSLTHTHTYTCPHPRGHDARVAQRLEELSLQLCDLLTHTHAHTHTDTHSLYIYIYIYH